jgi:hypothetical protein
MANMNLEELLQEAKSGNMTAQYDLAEYYGNLLKETKDEDEIYNYSKQAMIWLRKSAKQGYKPAVDAVNELNRASDTNSVSETVRTMEVSSDKPAVKPLTVDNEKPAAEKLPSSDTVVMNALHEKAKQVPPQNKAKPQPERYFASTTHIIVVCMLIISLIINIFLLWFLFRMVKSGTSTVDASISVSPSPAMEPTPSPTPEATPTPAPTSTPEPTPSPSPSPAVIEKWLDLTKYKDLKVIPEDIYDDYEYYTVIANDSLNMRSGPGTDYDKIGSIPGNTKVGAVADSLGWYLVYYDKNFGWVKGDYISNKPNAAPSPTPAPSPSAEPSVAPAAAPPVADEDLGGDPEA